LSRTGGKLWSKAGGVGELQRQWEEVCLELLDMWQKAGQVSSQDIENLSMAGILGIQKELAAKEMKADISFADSRKDNPANMTMSKNTLT
jgi:hypothetical protein